MPYGLSKRSGGDTPAKDAKMERCISDVMAKNPSMKRLNAILICKVSIQKSSAKGRR